MQKSKLKKNKYLLDDIWAINSEMKIKNINLFNFILNRV